MDVILVGYDDTEPARRALRRAREYAHAFGAQLVVASVVPVMVSVGRGVGAVDPVSDTADHDQQLAAAREILAEDGTAGEGSDTGAREPRYVTAIGDPVAGLLELAEEYKADLIVVGTREPSLVTRLFGQSVSSGVAAHAHRDVLVVHGG